MPDVRFLAVVRDVVEPVEDAAMVRILTFGTVRQSHLAGLVVQVVERLDGRVGSCVLLGRGLRFVEGRPDVLEDRLAFVGQQRVFAVGVLPGEFRLVGRRDARGGKEQREESVLHDCVGCQDLLNTNFCGLPVPSGPPDGRQRMTSSIFLATSKSLSVIPPAEWVINLTHSLPQVMAKSAWWYAASQTYPIAFTAMSVCGQPSVLYLRRSQPSSRYQPARPRSWILVAISDSE